MTSPGELAHGRPAPRGGGGQEQGPPAPAADGCAAAASPQHRHIGEAVAGALAVLLVWAVISILSTPSLRVTDHVDSAILRLDRQPADVEPDDARPGIDRLGSGWTVTLLILGMLVALMVFRRWRHLLTFLVSLAILEWASSSLYESFARPRPYGVTIIGRWAGYSLPSPPVRPSPPC